MFNSMAPSANLFALLNDDVEDGRKDIEVAVAVREEEKKVEATEKKKESQKKKTEKKKKERSRALNLQKKTYLRAKRLVLPGSVIRSQIVVRKEKPEEALSQIVVKKDNSEEEGQDGKTTPSNDAAQNHNNGGRRDRRDYGRANGGNGRRNIPLKVEENNNGEILVDEEGFQMVRSRRSNGGNGRRNPLKENNNGEMLVDKEGFQMVRSWRRRNGQTNLFNENNSKSTEAAVLLETNQESGKYVESNGESEKKSAADEEKKNSNEENRADNGKGKRPPSNSNKGRFDKSLEEKKKSEVKVYYTLKEYESGLQKMKGGSPGEAAKEMRTSNNMPVIRKEEESLDKVLKFKFVYPVRDIPTRRRSSDEVEKESSQQPREPVPEPEPKPEPVPVPVPGLDQFPELSKKRSP